MTLVKWVTKMADKTAEGGSYSANYSIGSIFSRLW